MAGASPAVGQARCCSGYSASVSDQLGFSRHSFLLGGGGSSRLRSAPTHQAERYRSMCAARSSVTPPPNASGNGSATTRASSRMLPIGEAVAVVRNGSSNGNGSAAGGTQRVKGPVNGAITKAQNGAAYGSLGNGAAVNGAVNGGVNGAVKGAFRGSSNGALGGRRVGMELVEAQRAARRARTVVPPAKLLPPPDENRVVKLSASEFKWARGVPNTLQRTLDIWSFVVLLRAGLWAVDAKWSYPGGFNEDKQSKRRRALAAFTRESILQLGPTFIKLGQLSSTRSDLLPREFVSELSLLQDRVPAFSGAEARAVVARELGAPVEVLFLEFDDVPLAAASLGQVHRAVLPNGEQVVVKIQRPHLRELFDVDLANMKKVAELFQNSEELGGPTRDWTGIYEECSTILYQEIDYINEGRNANRFARDFRKYPWVRVPSIYWDFTTRRVLTLEYAPGTKIDDVARLDKQGLDRSMLAQRAVESYLIQILRHGYFHADPHPGNLAVDDAGNLLYYDFGMMGELRPGVREGMLELFYSVYEKDARKSLDVLVQLGVLVPTGDLTPVRRSIQFFLNNLMAQSPDRAATVSAIGEDLFAIAVDQPFRFPATFTFVMRAFSTLEGIGATLEPGFSFAKVAAPFGQELLNLRNTSSRQDFLVQQLRKQAFQATEAAASVPLRVQRIEDFVRRVEDGDLKLRVRVLEAERSARRAGILQLATMNTVAAGTLLNAGLMLSLQEIAGPATACLGASAIFAFLVYRGMKRVQNLDKFEKMM